MKKAICLAVMLSFFVLGSACEKREVGDDPEKKDPFFMTESTITPEEDERIVGWEAYHQIETKTDEGQWYLNGSHMAEAGSRIYMILENWVLVFDRNTQVSETWCDRTQFSYVLEGEGKENSTETHRNGILENKIYYYDNQLMVVEDRSDGCYLLAMQEDRTHVTVVARLAEQSLDKEQLRISGGSAYYSYENCIYQLDLKTGRSEIRMTLTEGERCGDLRVNRGELYVASRTGTVGKLYRQNLISGKSEVLLEIQQFGSPEYAIVDENLYYYQPGTGLCSLSLETHEVKVLSEETDGFRRSIRFDGTYLQVDNAISCKNEEEAAGFVKIYDLQGNCLKTITCLAELPEENNRFYKELREVLSGSGSYVMIRLENRIFYWNLLDERQKWKPIGKQIDTFYH